MEQNCTCPQPIIHDIVHNSILASLYYVAGISGLVKQADSFYLSLSVMHFV